MRHLPLYKTRAQPIDLVEGKDVDPQCEGCRRSQSARTVCMRADADVVPGQQTLQGGLLVVGASPTKYEDNSSRPFSTSSSRQLRKLLRQLTDLPIVYKSALGCAVPKGKKTLNSEIEACRPYLKQIIDEAAPSRILCFGKEAYRTVLGTDAPANSVRRGYAYLEDGTPVFLLPNHNDPMQLGSFYRQKMVDNIEWALAATPEKPPYEMQVQIIETLQDARQAAAALRQGPYWVYDTETAGIMGSDYFELLCLAATPADGESVYLWDPHALADPTIRAPIVDLLVDPNHPMVGHNLKYDLKAVSFGMPELMDSFGRLLPQGVYGDTQLWTKLLDSEVLARLEYQAELVGMGGHKAENAKELETARKSISQHRARPKAQPVFPGFAEPSLCAARAFSHADDMAFAFGLVRKEVLHRYCALDTVATARLAKLHAPTIFGTPHHALMNETFLRHSTAIVAQIEAWGMSTSVDNAALARTMLCAEREIASNEIRSHGFEGNINSNDQLSEFLYSEIGLPVLSYTDSGNPSVSAPTLEKLEGKHPVIAPILKHAKVEKLIGAYCDGLIFSTINGRVRGNINLTGTRAGRWSASNPNLHTIPGGGPYAKYIKGIFTAPPDHVIMQADFSQLELRIAALLTGDPKMTEIYQRGEDLHMRTAQLISGALGKTPSEVDKDDRRYSKAIQFALWYGSGDGSIAEKLGVTRRQAAQYRAEILGQFDHAEPFIKRCKADANRDGISWTFWDGQKARYRELPGIDGPDDKISSTCNNAAVNSPIQGTAALYMERALGQIVMTLKALKLPVRVTMTVHDSVILEVPFGLVHMVSKIVRDSMEKQPSGAVPLVADVEIGLTWADLLDLDTVRKAGHAVAELGEVDAAKALGFDDLEDFRPYREMAARLG